VDTGYILVDHLRRGGRRFPARPRDRARGPRQRLNWITAGMLFCGAALLSRRLPRGPPRSRSSALRRHGAQLPSSGSSSSVLPPLRALFPQRRGSCRAPWLGSLLACPIFHSVAPCRAAARRFRARSPTTQPRAGPRFHRPHALPPLPAEHRPLPAREPGGVLNAPGSPPPIGRRQTAAASRSDRARRARRLPHPSTRSPPSSVLTGFRSPVIRATLVVAGPPSAASRSPTRSCAHFLDVQMCASSRSGAAAAPSRSTSSSCAA
jgi:hypothetical protein